MMRVLVAALTATTLTLAGCGNGSSSESASPAKPSTIGAAASPATGETARPGEHKTHGEHHQGKPAKAVPLRPGEQRTTLEMAQPYTPSAPYGAGTDDYRCFLLDPKLDQDAWLTGSNVLPGNPDVVHHVILFRIPPESAAAAEAKDAGDPGEGWTCFGGTGVAGEFDNPDDASWLGAWAPGGHETVLRPGYGVPLDRGSRIVMQVHYNLLAGTSPDTSATQVRWTPRTFDLTALHTMLLPAPVELPCRPGHDASPLCNREASVADARARFGDVGNMANLLHLLCGTDVQATGTTTCTRTVQRPLTILGAAGHMHLLGRWIKIEVNVGTPEARTVLDIPEWDFDNQGAHPVQPVHLVPGDTVTVTCHHEQDLRDLLPAFDGQEEKYVVWAEGTTDEMCLGMLQVAFDGDAVG
jgi:hypothetical protein